MKKAIAILCVAIFAISVLAACTKDKEGNGSEAGEPGISMQAEPSVESPVEEENREYSIPDDAIDISNLFPEEPAPGADGSTAAEAAGADMQFGADSPGGAQE